MTPIWESEHKRRLQVLQLFPTLSLLLLIGDAPASPQVERATVRQATALDQGFKPFKEKQFHHVHCRQIQVEKRQWYPHLFFASTSSFWIETSVRRSPHVQRRNLCQGSQKTLPRSAKVNVWVMLSRTRERRADRRLPLLADWFLQCVQICTLPIKGSFSNSMPLSKQYVSTSVWQAASRVRCTVRSEETVTCFEVGVALIPSRYVRIGTGTTPRGARRVPVVVSEVRHTHTSFSRESRNNQPSPTMSSSMVSWHCFSGRVLRTPLLSSRRHVPLIRN